MYLNEVGLRSIEKLADKKKKVELLFLIEIYRMLKQLLEKCENSGNCGNDRADSSEGGND